MLTIKKSRRDNTFILYDNHNFQYHTHVHRRELAMVILRNVTKKLIPKSQDIEFVKSHLRVSQDRDYTNKLLSYLKSIDKKVSDKPLEDYHTISK